MPSISKLWLAVFAITRANVEATRNLEPSECKIKRRRYDKNDQNDTTNLIPRYLLILNMAHLSIFFSISFISRIPLTHTNRLEGLSCLGV